MALSTLDESVLGAIRTAGLCAEGRGVRVEVKRKADVENIKKLVEIKMAN